MSYSSSALRPGLAERISETITGLKTCRLCWRITLAIFVAILAVEAAILFFSVQNFERDRLVEVEREGLILTRAILREVTGEDNQSAAIAAIGPRLRDTSALLALAVFDPAGHPIGRFGDGAGALKMPKGAVSVTRYQRYEGGGYMDLVWPPRRTRSAYIVAARIDTREIAPQVRAFIWRILGLVLLISTSVTVVAMLVLERLVLRPIRELRDGLVALAQDPENPTAHRIFATGTDELGEVAEKFDFLTAELAEAFVKIELQNAELREKAITEEANQAKSGFLANMNHELRTPLNAIIGFSELVKTQPLGELGDPRYLEYIEHIHEGGTHLLGVIDDILDISRIESGTVSLQLEPIQIGEIVESCLRYFKDHLDQKDIRVSTPPQDAWPEMIADARLVRQMLVKLLSNAIKFSETGSEVEISLEIEDDHCLRVIIADTGIGMTADEIVVAMERFGQVDGTFSKANDGTGLGLPLVKLLAELHGGVLEIESKKGQGTRANIVFPAERAVLKN